MSVNMEKLFTDLFLKDQVEIKEGKTEIRLRLMKQPKGIAVGVHKLGGDCHGISFVSDTLEEAMADMRCSWYHIHKTNLPESPPAPVRTWYARIIRGHRPYPITQSALRPEKEDYFCVNADGEEGYMLPIDTKKYPELNDLESDGQGNVFVSRYDLNSFTEYCEISDKGKRGNGYV